MFYFYDSYFLSRLLRSALSTAAALRGMSFDSAQKSHWLPVASLEPHSAHTHKHREKSSFTHAHTDIYSLPALIKSHRDTKSNLHTHSLFPPITQTHIFSPTRTHTSFHHTHIKSQHGGLGHSRGRMHRVQLVHSLLSVIVLNSFSDIWGVFLKGDTKPLGHGALAQPLNWLFFTVCL